MSTIEAFPSPSGLVTEFRALVTASTATLDAIPGAVYICDAEGWLVRYNAEAANLWGRQPDLIARPEKFCGSHRLIMPDGTPLRHDDCPMAEAVRQGTSRRNLEVIIERPDGSQIPILVNIRPLLDHRGAIEGAINCFQDISEQKAMRAEVERKNRDLEDFFENSAIGLHIVAGDGIIVRANRAELAMLGYAAEEYVGRHIAEFHIDATVIGQILQRLARGESLERCPARLRAKDGSIRHVLITSNSRFENGKLAGTRCFTTDVTDLYEAERARGESERRLAATYNAATVGIAEADASGRLLRVNDALCRMLGRSRESLLRLAFFDYTHADDYDEDAASYARQVRGEIDSYSIRKRALLADGTTAFFDVYSSSVKDASGKFLYGVRVAQNVTEAKLMEDRLREGERQMRDILEALPAAVYTTDAGGRITFFNKACVELAGRTPRIGEQWCVTWRLRTPEGLPLPHDQCPMAVAIREDRPVRGVAAVAERPDGSLVPFMPYPTPLHDSEGRLIGAINMLVDITERKRAEKRQKILIDELNHRVKNTLATVQSLALQTARHSNDMTAFNSSFERRLLALARAHDLLTDRRWEDTPLEDLTRQILAPVMSGTEDRVRIGGPALTLRPRAALSFTMALNELATNATKYGALSTTSGSLSLTWKIVGEADQPLVELNWMERGGPPVSAPTRRGFGTRLMERCIERDLGGEFDLVFDPQGISCRMTVPLPATASNA